LAIPGIQFVPERLPNGDVPQLYSAIFGTSKSVSDFLVALTDADNKDDICGVGEVKKNDTTSKNKPLQLVDYGVVVAPYRVGQKTLLLWGNAEEFEFYYVTEDHNGNKTWQNIVVRFKLNNGYTRKSRFGPIAYRKDFVGSTPMFVPHEMKELVAVMRHLLVIEKDKCLERKVERMRTRTLRSAKTAETRDVQKARNFAHNIVGKLQPEQCQALMEALKEKHKEEKKNRQGKMKNMNKKKN
jgi:hypothetical protein